MLVTSHNHNYMFKHRNNICFSNATFLIIRSYNFLVLLQTLALEKT